MYPPEMPCAPTGYVYHSVGTLALGEMQPSFLLFSLSAVILKTAASPVPSDWTC